MLLQIAIAIASSMALIMALLLRTGIGSSREWRQTGAADPTAVQVAVPRQRQTRAPTAMPSSTDETIPRPHASEIEQDPADSEQRPAPRQRIRIGAVSLEVPEGKTVTVLQDDSGTLTVMIRGADGATGNDELLASDALQAQIPDGVSVPQRRRIAEDRAGADRDGRLGQLEPIAA